MTKEMKAFLSELADLLEKHNIDEIEAVDDGENYYPSVDGVEINMFARWDENQNIIRDHCDFRLPRYFDCDVLRKLIEEIN